MMNLMKETGRVGTLYHQTAKNRSIGCVYASGDAANTSTSQEGACADMGLSFLVGHVKDMMLE